MQLALALSLSSSPHGPVVDERAARKDKRHKAREEQLQEEEAQAEAQPDRQPLVPSPAEPEICLACQDEDLTTDFECTEQGGWGRAPCCHQPFHVNCLIRWANQQSEVEEYPFEPRGTDLRHTTTTFAICCPACRAPLRGKSRRRMELEAL